MAPSRVDDAASQTTSGHTPCSSKPKPTVYIIDPFHPKAIEHAKTLFNVILPTDPAFADWRQNATAILMRGSYLRVEDIAACPNLRAIGKHGVGTDRIDADACAARGIRILNAPGANTEAVAELVLALALSVARQIPSITARQMREPVRKETCAGMTLRGKTVGVIGMGNIGHRVAEMFSRAFDCPIVAYDPYISADAWKDLEHTRANSYRDLFLIADILTIHVPLTKDTLDMIGYNELSMMKPTSILLNTSRGGIVNEVQLQRALTEGLIWGAGLDAHEQEPPTVGKYGELWQLPNVVSTPHIGAATEDAQLMSAMGAVDNLYNYLKA